MCIEKEVQALRQRYDLRASGAELRDVMEEEPEVFLNSDMRMRTLDNVSGKMKGRDKLFFRQGFLTRAGELGG